MISAPWTTPAAEPDLAAEDRRRAAADGDDVLSMLLGARHEDGSPMSDRELRDELVTMLVAGHETTAHTLAWAVERLRRHPAALARLVEEVDAGGRAYRDAVIREVQRVRPVISFAGRNTIQPFELGGYRIPVRSVIALSAGLTHYDPELFEEPEAFRPERFLGHERPSTYAWIPFGGGIRRCLGAALAMAEQRVVLAEVARRLDVRAAEPEPERAGDRSTWDRAGDRCACGIRMAARRSMKCGGTRGRY